MCLGGITAIDTEVAKGLKSHRGHLQLTGVDKLSPEVASELVGCKGVIHLDRITVLDEEIAMILVRHRGAPGTGFVLGADALRELSDKAEAAIRKSPHIRLGNWSSAPSSF